MSTVVAAIAAPSLPRNYPALAPSTTPHSMERPDTMMSDGGPNSTSAEQSPTDGRKSPKLMRSFNNSKVIVKKEPGSPPVQNGTRHRPRKLDLNLSSTTASTPANTRPSGGPITGRDALGMLDVGLACLSPGFQTQDPTMREQLQRSISVRDQQRSIIEARLHKSAKGDGPVKDGNNMLRDGPPSAKKRPPLAGLSIKPPSAQQFANERVIQSAPLNQTFTGRHQPAPISRPVERISSYQQRQIPHVVAAIQTNNRLPPISDVFNAETLQHSRPPFQHSNSTPQFNGPPLPSPGFPPQTAHPNMQQSGRAREYRSAEEAVQELTGGREDLQPKIVRYGGRQPPTPPSPRTEGSIPSRFHLGHAPSGSTSRRRSRHEYEADSSPPLGNGREQGPRTGPFGEGRDSPAAQRAKKEEFLKLCARAWDLFHS